MIETINTLVLAHIAIAEADRYEIRGGKYARAKIIVTFPARVMAISYAVRLTSALVGRVLGREPDSNSARVAGIWAGELALRRLSGPLAPALALPFWPQGIANAGAIGATTGGLVVVTAPVARFDDAALRAILKHEMGHLSLGHLVIKAAAVGLFAAVAPPIVRSARQRFTPALPCAVTEITLLGGVAAASAVVSRRFETAADDVAIAEGSADGLARALDALASYAKERSGTGPAGRLRRRLRVFALGRAALFLNDTADRVFASHPPASWRIARAATAAKAD